MEAGEEAQPGQLITSEQRNIQHHVTSCSTTEVWERKIKQKGKCWYSSSGILFHHRYEWWAPVFLGMPKHLLPIGSGQWIPCFALIACAELTSPTKLSLLQPMSFLTLALPMSKWLPGAGWLPELNHNDGPIQWQRKRKKKYFRFLKNVFGKVIYTTALAISDSSELAISH